MINDVWLTVTDFPDYEVSNCGRVRRLTPGHSVDAGHEMALSIVCGYRVVGLRRPDGVRKLMKVHRLVAAAFIGPCPVGNQVNHRDLNKQNNHVSNLEYVTLQQNVDHARAGGRYNEAVRHCGRRGEANSRAKLTAKVATEIRSRRAAGESTRSVADAVGISTNHVRAVSRGVYWPYTAGPR